MYHDTRKEYGEILTSIKSSDPQFKQLFNSIKKRRSIQRKIEQEKDELQSRSVYVKIRREAGLPKTEATLYRLGKEGVETSRQRPRTSIAQTKFKDKTKISSRHADSVQKGNSST